MRKRIIAAAALVLSLAFGGAASAHDIPNDVVARLFVRPEGQRLRLLVRVPLKAMADVDFPRIGPGYLDLGRAGPSLRNAALVWIARSIELYEDDVRRDSPAIAAVMASLPSDLSFRSYDEALAHVLGPPLPRETELYWEQGMLDVLLEYAIASEGSRFSIRPGLERAGQRVTTALRFLPPGGGERAFELHGDPGVVRLDPRWRQAALLFVRSGVRHILGGVDHLLFLFCLVIPFRRLRPLVWIVTSFTVAHSITLIASAYDGAPSALWFPPLIETLIAMSIVYMALENIVGASLGRRWAIAFAFGLVHGFGFSFALGDTLQFAGSHLLTSLVSFNVGVELGQLAVLLAIIGVLEVVFRAGLPERAGTIVLSALVAHTGWHWMIERGERLCQFPWAAPNAAALAAGLRWLMVLVAVSGLLWGARRFLTRRRAGRSARRLAVGGVEADVEVRLGKEAYEKP